MKQEDGTDESWLKIMPFRPDGLQISNLRQFHSPFAQTRARFVAIYGQEMPMMVSGFYGYKDQLQQKATALSIAKKIKDIPELHKARADARADMGTIGVVVGENLAREEAQLQELGFRGLSVHWNLIEAMDHRRDVVVK